MSDERVIAARCTLCAGEFTQDEVEGVSCCPRCGTRSKPMDPEDDVTVAINWHELRILSTWAERFAGECATALEASEDYRGMPVVVRAIVGRLHKQYPLRGALTLKDEFAELRERGIKFEHNIPGIE